jgi:hypothetical protein
MTNPRKRTCTIRSYVKPNAKLGTAFAHEHLGELIKRRTPMRHFVYSLLVVACAQPLQTLAQPLPQPRVPPLASAIANGAPMAVHLHRGEDNGTLIGGETYLGHYNQDSNTFTFSGPGRRDDGVVIPVTATYGGADPLWQELSVFGALYTFDSRGNLFLGNSGRLAGKVSLRR